MFFPLSDDNPTRRRPVVNYTLIALNVAAFLLTLAARDPESVIRWTMVPAELRYSEVLDARSVVRKAKTGAGY